MKRKWQKLAAIMIVGVHAGAFKFLKRECRVQSKKLGVKVSIAVVVDQIIKRIKAEKN